MKLHQPFEQFRGVKRYRYLGWGFCTLGGHGECATTKLPWVETAAPLPCGHATFFVMLLSHRDNGASPCDSRSHANDTGSESLDYRSHSLMPQGCPNELNPTKIRRIMVHIRMRENRAVTIKAVPTSPMNNCTRARVGARHRRPQRRRQAAVRLCYNVPGLLESCYVG